MIHGSPSAAAMTSSILCKSLSGSGLVGAFGIFAIGLVNGYNPWVWWCAYGFWSALYLKQCLSFVSKSAFTTWLCVFLTIPKRNPNLDYISALNASGDGMFPLVELILITLALGAFLQCARQAKSLQPSFSPYRYVTSFTAKALFAATLIGAIVTIHNNNSNVYYTESVFMYAICRNLRLLHEAIILASVAYIGWSPNLVASIRKLAILAAGISFAELLLWALPLSPNTIVRYVYDFRDGYRAVTFGTGGAMLTYAWSFVAAILAMTNSRRLFYCCAVIGSVAAIASLHRTQAFSLLFVVFMLSAIFCTQAERLAITFTLICFTAALGGPLRARFQDWLTNVSELKGGEYFALDSMESRFQLGRIALSVLKQAPITGIGQNALTAYTVNGTVTGTLDARDFIEALVASGDFDSIERGERVFDAHNLFISLIVESSIAGFVIVGAFFAFGWKIAQSCRRDFRAHSAAGVLWLGCVLAGVSQAEPYIICLIYIVASLGAYKQGDQFARRNAV